MEISCVITVHDRPDYFIECVQSLVRQTLAPKMFEIVAVDDASTLPCMKKTMAQAKRLAAKAGIAFIDEYLPANLGPGEARNRGNDLARGNIIVVCDSDDVSGRERLQRISKFFRDHPEKMAFFSGGYRTDRELDNPVIHHASIQQVAGLDHGQAIWHPTMAYRAAITRGDNPVRYPAEAADVDYAFLLQARQVLGDAAFGCLDEPLVSYRQHPGQISKAQNQLQRKLFHEHQNQMGLKVRPKIFGDGPRAPSNHERRSARRQRRSR